MDSPELTERDRREDEWVRLFANRDDLSEEYAVLLRRNGAMWDGWEVLNRAILRRWSMAGLHYIKRRAWKIVTQDL